MDWGNWVFLFSVSFEVSHLCDAGNGGDFGIHLAFQPLGCTGRGLSKSHGSS